MRINFHRFRNNFKPKILQHHYVKLKEDYMQIRIWIISIMILYTMSFDQIYAQDQDIDEFLEWPSTSNYNFILISLVIMIVISVIANYLWSNRKGRKFTAE